MPLLDRRFPAVMAAVAVLVVAATCSPAGCLLPGELVYTTAGPQKSCCAAHAHNMDQGDLPPNSGDRKSHSCPTCDQTLISGKSIDKGISQVSSLWFAGPFDFSLPNVEVLPPSQISFRLSNDLPPPSAPPTLLALCCALLI